MNTPTYLIAGAALVAAMVWIKTSDSTQTPRANALVHQNEQVQEPGTSLPDEGTGWSCFLSNASGSGRVPCILIKEPNRVTFSFEDSAQITFHTQDQEGSTSEVSGVQVEGANREPAFGFCEFFGNGARCEATNGGTIVEYEAR